jgi:hypothetical protein
MAEKMISISDNTAADHLLRTLGRAYVESELPLAGHMEPALDVPLLATRDMFVFKLALTPDEQQQYLAARPDVRRTLLDGEILQVPLADAARALPGWTAPRFVDTMEWFASPEDVCRAFVALRAYAAAGMAGREVLDALSINPGEPVDAKRFPYVGYKGGSEPGVLTMNWLLQRSDQRWFVVSAMWNDTAELVDEDRAAYAALAAVNLVGQAP